MAKILIIDDDPSGTQLLITLLGFEGYQGFSPDDWYNPLVSVEQHLPDLVIMDVHLRNRDGVEILAQLRAWPDPQVAATPVLMMSAEDHRRRCLAAGANDFVEKPFDRRALLQAIEGVLEGNVSDS